MAEDFLEDGEDLGAAAHPKFEAYDAIAEEQGVNQEFTHVATPEENAFIEAYHSIVERTIERRCQFESIYEAAMVMYRWKQHYNERRLHGSLGNKTPQHPRREPSVHSASLYCIGQ